MPSLRRCLTSLRVEVRFEPIPDVRLTCAFDRLRTLAKCLLSTAARTAPGAAFYNASFLADLD